MTARSAPLGDPERAGVDVPEQVPSSPISVLLAVLQDGRQLEGQLIIPTDQFEVAGAMFEASVIKEMRDE